MRGPHIAAQLPMNGTAAFFAVAVTVFYWWQNIKGIEESSDRALDVMKITTVMVVILLIWGIYSAIHLGAKLAAISHTFASCTSVDGCAGHVPAYQVRRRARPLRQSSLRSGILFWQ